jgi:hypothetical protein
MAEVRNIKMTVSGVYAQVRRGADVTDYHDLGPARTDVCIVDVGTWVEFAHDRQGITIQKSNGVSVQNVVGAVDFSAPIRDVADALLTAWCDDYDGDPRENELRVEVSRDGKTETVYA